jgi:hypothetical protein
MRILPLLVLLVSVLRVSAATYYVRADGSAANKGIAVGPASDATKCLSMSGFNGETFSAGDTVYFSAQGGDYTNQCTIPSSGTAIADITFEGLLDGGGGSKPLIDVSASAASPNGIKLSAINYVAVKNFRIKGSGGAAAFYFRDSSGTAGAGYTVKGRDIDVISNYGASTGNSDGFSSGEYLGSDDQAEFWNITADKCRTNPADGSSHQCFALHENSKGKVHGAVFSDSNYWYVGTLNTQCWIDNLTATTPKTFGVLLAANATDANLIDINGGSLSLGSTGGFLNGQLGGNTNATCRIRNCTISISDPNKGLEFWLDTVILQNNSIEVNTASFEALVSTNSTLNLLGNRITLTKLYGNTFLTAYVGSTINAIGNTFINGSGALNPKILYFQVSGGSVCNNVFLNCNQLYDVAKIDAGIVNWSNNTHFNSTNRVDWHPFWITGGTLNFTNNILSQSVAGGSWAIYFSGGTTNVGYNCFNNVWEYPGGGGTLVADPQFIGAGMDFRLKPTSPCIGAGALVGLTADKDGNHIVNLPDIGAYEYTVEPSVAIGGRMIPIRR